MHKAVKIYCSRILAKFPSMFNNKDVLDCGSLDINGNNRYLFTNCRHTGIDIVDGKNVDVVCRLHKYITGKQFDVIISTEMLEHDSFLEKSLQRMFQLLKPGGLLLLTAAGYGREEHGTTAMHPGDSPLTHDYYKNLDPADFYKNLPLEQFSWYEISYKGTDIRFTGIKRTL